MASTRLKQKKLLLIPLMGALPAGMLILFGYIGSFTRYIADDYCSAYWAQRFGLFRSVWHWYITWSGRFSAYASDWFVMLIGTRNVHLIPPIMLALWVIITAAAAYLYLRRSSTEADAQAFSLLLGVVALFAVLLLSPSIQQSFYWWNGMRSYSLPLLIMTLFAGLYQWRIESLTTNSAVLAASVFSFLFLFANAGLGDVSAVLQFCLLSVLACLLIIRRSSRRAELPILAAGWLGTALAILVIILAPGNAFREAYFPPHPGLFKLLAIAWQGYASLLIGMVGTPARVLGLIGAVLVGVWIGSQSTRRSEVRLWMFVSLIVLGLLLSFTTFLPASFGLSEPPPPRNLMVPVFALTISLVGAAFVAGNQFLDGLNHGIPAIVLIVLAILTINLSAGINIAGTYQGRNTYITYARNWDADEARILQAKAAGQTVVTLPVRQNWAGLDVLSDNPKNWLNTCASGFYGIQIIGGNP